MAVKYDVAAGLESLSDYTLKKKKKKKKKANDMCVKATNDHES